MCGQLCVPDPSWWSFSISQLGPHIVHLGTRPLVALIMILHAIDSRVAYLGIRL